MPLRADIPTIVRFVIGTRGKLKMHTELILRFGYGAVVPWVTRLENGALRAIAGPDMVVLRTPVHRQRQGHDHGRRIHRRPRRDHSARADLCALASSRCRIAHRSDRRARQSTETFWHEWSAKCRPAGEWSEAVKRSMITLKALTYAPTGGIVAAPTTSLPEQHRRQAQLGLSLLLAARRHADAARRHACRLLRGSAGLARMAAARGRRQSRISCRSCTASAASGGSPNGSRTGCPATRNPRRCASATPRTPSCSSTCSARSWTPIIRRGAAGLTSDESGWAVQLEFLKHLKKYLAPARPGHLGNARPGAAFHLFQGHGLGRLRPRDQERGNVRARRSARRLARAARRDLRRGLRARLQQEAGHLRAGLWLRSARRQPADVALRRLSAGDRSAHRRHHRGDRDAVCCATASSCATAPRRSRTRCRRAKARSWPAASGWSTSICCRSASTTPNGCFGGLSALRNDVGLLSEEYDPALKRLVGNFPQAFSHLALVNSAYNLTRARKPVHQRAQDEHAPPERGARRRPSEAAIIDHIDIRIYLKLRPGRVTPWRIFFGLTRAGRAFLGLFHREHGAGQR